MAARVDRENEARLLTWFVPPAKDNTGFDAAFGAVLPFSVFGAGLAFSTLYAAERAEVSSRATQCLAWAFALYLWAASLSLGLRLSVNVFTVDGNAPIGFALSCNILACTVATMLMALSVYFTSRISGVGAAGVLVAAVVGYMALTYFAYDKTHKSADLRASRRALAKLSLRTHQQLPYPPTEDLQAEIEKFLRLYSQFGNAFTYLDRRGNDDSDMAKFQKSPFQRLPEEEMAKRLAYAAMAFGHHRRRDMNGLLNEYLLEGAREFIAPEMRKWDPIIKQLIERGGGGNDWWRRPILSQVLRMWWLFQAHGGADPPAQPVNAAGAVPDSPQPEAGTVANPDYVTRDAHGNIGGGASLRCEHPTRQTPRSSASSIHSLTSVRRDGVGLERHSMESLGRELPVVGQHQMPRNAGRIAPLPSLSDSPV